MTVELIPVLEIMNFSQEIISPGNGPYWEYAEEWETFNQICNATAGYPDKFNSYLKGSAFYKLSEISYGNLVKLTKDYTAEFRNEDCDREQIFSFSGGYVLKIEGRDKYFPQCCGDLSDIQYWDNLVSEKNHIFYAGHPYPEVKICNGIITFDFTGSESFAPALPEKIINITTSSLQLAIEVVRTELFHFLERIKQINLAEQINIENIDELLVWGV